jgi:hypothetical protein
MLANQDVRQRVEAGKKQECLIIQALNRAGMNLSTPPTSEALLEKVDAWGQHKGQRMGIQIKFRETGKDLLFENLPPPPLNSKKLAIPG